jgi:hypothetical protein
LAFVEAFCCYEEFDKLAGRACRRYMPVLESGDGNAIVHDALDACARASLRPRDDDFEPVRYGARVISNRASRAFDSALATSAPETHSRYKVSRELEHGEHATDEAALRERLSNRLGIRVDPATIPTDTFDVPDPDSAIEAHDDRDEAAAMVSQLMSDDRLTELDRLALSMKARFEEGIPKGEWLSKGMTASAGSSAATTAVKKARHILADLETAA